jgi:hypothetical protein
VITGTEDRQHAYVALICGTHDNSAYVFTQSPKRADLARALGRPPNWPATTASPPGHPTMTQPPPSQRPRMRWQ